MVKLMESDKEITGPINIGNPNEFTILELAELVLKLTSYKSKIIFKSIPEDDPKQRQPNINLAKDKLNWEPKIELEDGLKETIKYFKALLKISFTDLFYYKHKLVKYYLSLTKYINFNEKIK
jgi:UDP-glucuronate decarboxylase